MSFLTEHLNYFISFHVPPDSSTLI